MSRKIFLLDSHNRPEPMEEVPYKSENLLQGYLQDCPDLLAGDEIADGIPRRWLLIQREMGVADSEGSGSRWSIDHLFVDQDAVPTLVEVKRSSDTRIRREVVGQILEYAANASKHWPTRRIREQFEERCEREGKEADQELAGVLGSDADPEDFWESVSDNLNLGRLRLLFVADRVPAELQRIVEFLNEQMVRTEVLAVEIRQFVGKSDQKTLVPRLIGKTGVADDTKGRRSTRRSQPWSPDSFVAKLKLEERERDLAVVGRILQWAADRGFSWDGGRGASKASISLRLAPKVWPISIYEGTGRCVLHVQFNWMGPEYDEVKTRRPIARDFSEIQGVELDPERPYPGVRFDLLDSAQAQAALVIALERTVARLRRE